MNKDEILAKLAAGELKVEEASKLLAAIEQPKRGTLYCKVSEKGAVSVYGLQRMPVTLYLDHHVPRAITAGLLSGAMSCPSTEPRTTRNKCKRLSPGLTMAERLYFTSVGMKT